VAPILQQHCQQCHREGEIAPMPLGTYKQARPWAQAIKEQVLLKKMPPWFADPHHGKFANDPSLSAAEIHTLAEWADSGARESGWGQETARPWVQGWNIPQPDAVFSMPEAFPVPAKGEVAYQYFDVPTNFTEDHWVQAVEVRPSARAAVHHVVVYIREKDDVWIKGPTKSDILEIYTPGTLPAVWKPGQAKKIPAGAHLVFQVHYTPTGQPVSDRTVAGVIFAKEPPAERVLTIQLGNSSFAIPPGRADYPVSVMGTLPHDATLLSFFPHMHLRGAGFEYLIIPPKGPPITLLKVENYNFYWQLSYVLAEPLKLKAGTRLEATGWFDNSANNPLNPDPKATVRYGEQSWEEMCIGFFDLAIPADMDKVGFFVR
jgi:hypothetical protein